MAKFLGCQLAHDWEKWVEPALGYALLEPKLDGYRLSAIVHDDGKVTLHCRQEAEPIWSENLEHVRQAIAEIAEANGERNIMIDGEVMGANWNETSKLLRKRRVNMDEEMRVRVARNVKFRAFDVVSLIDVQEGTIPGKRKTLTFFAMPYTERRKWLVDLLSMAEESSRGVVQIVTQFEVRSEEELLECHAELLDLEYEGSMVKDPGAPYVFDRSPYWLKVKPHKTIELEVTGMVEGEGKCEGMLGALICRNEKGEEIRVGGGFTDEQRKDIWNMRKQITGLFAEVKVQDDNVATARHPVFIRFRTERAA